MNAGSFGEGIVSQLLHDADERHTTDSQVSRYNSDTMTMTHKQ